MHPRLERYVTRVYSLLSNHWLIVDRQVDFVDVGEGSARIKGRVIILDGSPLYLKEAVMMQDDEPTKVDYSYQFRNEDEPGFFRYDSESHGRPQSYHHKHAYQRPIREIETAPGLLDILKEIDSILTSEMT